MLYQRLIPTLLLKNKRLVKGARYSNFRDAGNPKTTARVHNCQGADELIVFDIDASKEKREPDYETIKMIAEECFMPLCVGGGISNIEIAHQCMEAGADKLCLTMTALENPSLISELAHCFGSQAIVVGIDLVRDGNSVFLFDHRNHEILKHLDPWHWLKQTVQLGAGEVRLMSVDREGSLLGYDFSLYKKARSLVNVPIILEGGSGSLNHLQEAFEAGVDGVATGAMLVFSDANLVKIKQHMLTQGCNTRR